MAYSRNQKAPPKKEEPKKRPVMSWGPLPTDRNTSIEVSCWENEVEVETGSITTYNVTIKRSFRDAEGVWHANANMRPHDIPVLMYALNQAYSWILEKKNPSRSEE